MKNIEILCLNGKAFKLIYNNKDLHYQSNERFFFSETSLFYHACTLRHVCSLFKMSNYLPSSCIVIGSFSILNIFVNVCLF